MNAEFDSMAIDPDDLQRRLCDQLCATVRVERRPDGALMLDSGFAFPDGDSFSIYLSKAPGGVRLSDLAAALFRYGRALTCAPTI